MAASLGQEGQVRSLLDLSAEALGVFPQEMAGSFEHLDKRVRTFAPPSADEGAQMEFLKVCSRGDLLRAQYLLSLPQCAWNDPNVSAAAHESSTVPLLRVPDDNKHVYVAHWLQSLGCVKAPEPQDDEDADWTFQTACEQVHEQVMDLLRSLGKIDVHDHADKAFRHACGNGHLEVAQWLHSLGGVDVHAECDGAFRFACAHGHSAVARWLHSLGGVNVHALRDDAFCAACYEGHLEIAKWLRSLDGQPTTAPRTLLEVVRPGQVAEWLATLN